MKTLKMKRGVVELELSFESSSRLDGTGLSVMVYCRSGKDPWTPWFDLTANLGRPTGARRAYVDARWHADVVDALVERGWAREVGWKMTGGISYPLMEFSEEFLGEVCV